MPYFTSIDRQQHKTGPPASPPRTSAAWFLKRATRTGTPTRTEAAYHCHQNASPLELHQERGNPQSQESRITPQIHRAGRQAGAMKPVHRAGWELAVSLPHHRGAALAEFTCAPPQRRIREECPCAAPAHVHSTHAAFPCWSTACSPHPARSADWPHGPFLALAPCIRGVILDLI